MTISLDTNVFIDLANDDDRVWARYDCVVGAGEELVISVVAWQELRVGAILGRQGAGAQSVIDRLLRGVRVVDYDRTDAESGARLRSRLSRGDAAAHDVMIAGQAVARGWTLVTGNARHFAGFEGLMLSDWRRPSDQEE